MKPLYLLLVFSAALFYASCTRNPEPIIGVKIYDYQGDYRALADRWASIGINTAFVSAVLAANDTFRQALREHNIAVYIIFPVFQNPEILERDTTLYAVTNSGTPGKDAWVEFVCPSREAYRKAKTDELSELVRNLNPDGVSLDFIRQFVFWEMVYPDRAPESIGTACFCDSCLAQFTAQEAVLIPETCITTLQQADFIRTRHLAAWNAFRTGLITSMAGDLAQAARTADANVMVNIHAVPWREEDFGNAGISVAAQDLKALGEIGDFVSPMCYSQMLKRDAQWISSVVKDMDRRAPGRVLPSIQVYPYYIADAFTAEDLRLCIRAALEPPSRGVVFWSWPLLEQDSTRVKVVGEEVNNE